MVELTEAEKRKQLRERRAAKIKNGTSRLSKITGEHQGLEEVQPEEVKPADSIPDVLTSNTNVSNKKNNRISQSFDDPEVEDIAQYLASTRTKPSNFKGRTQLPHPNANEADEFTKALNQIIGNHQKDHSIDDADIPNPFGNGNQFDIFSQLLSGTGATGAGTNSLPDFSSLLQTGFTNGENLPGFGGDGDDFTYNQQLAEYNKSLNDKFKAQWLLFKLIFNFVLVLLFKLEENFILDSIYSKFGTSILFLKSFIAFEIIFTTIYALRLFKISDNFYNYDFQILTYLEFLPPNILPNSIKSKIRLAIRYFELVKFILFDISVVIVLNLLWNFVA
ncbi:hypothetical protein WICMUC_005258 [Wickerhamomyces mucosus]|uniref:Golgi to ER traffic protein 2 n=1 Tax=Wickerhamomyces mucosus TaxID=1378264 RepID=A0A9P8P937_9ASCO|nr:hypothetical protein WICMUC_005258 [Wickerhamomyces mucosus]